MCTEDILKSSNMRTLQVAYRNKNKETWGRLAKVPQENALLWIQGNVLCLYLLHLLCMGSLCEIRLVQWNSHTYSIYLSSSSLQSLKWNHSFCASRRHTCSRRLLRFACKQFLPLLPHRAMPACTMFPVLEAAALTPSNVAPLPFTVDPKAPQTYCQHSNGDGQSRRKETPKTREQAQFVSQSTESPPKPNFSMATDVRKH